MKRKGIMLTAVICAAAQIFAGMPLAACAAETLEEAPAAVVTAETLEETPAAVVTAEALAEAPASVVTADHFEMLSKDASNIVMSERLPMEELLAMMPGSLTAVMSDGTSKEFPVSWETYEDYDAQDTFYYVFTPVFGDGVTVEDVNVPYIIVWYEPDMSGESGGGSVTDENGDVLMTWEACLEREEEQWTIFEYATEEMGLNSAAAAGILANIKSESNFNPTIVGDHGTSYGLCQWHNARWSNLLSYCQEHELDSTTVYAQMRFLHYELEHNYKRVYTYLSSVPNTADGAYDAAYYFCARFEIPANTQVKANYRGNVARDVYFPAFGGGGNAKEVEPEPVPQSVPAPVNKNVPTDRGAVEVFVSRFYSNILGREPDDSGLKFWTDNLMNGNLSGSRLAYGFFTSQELENMHLTNDAYVELAYQGILGRASDPAGKKYWVETFDSGCTRMTIIRGFAYSKEFEKLCAECGVKVGVLEVKEARDKNVGATKFVSRLFTCALGRGYDITGLNYWCQKIIDDPKQANIINISTNGFFNSEEFKKKNLSNTEFVKVLYRTFLGRESDPVGLKYWTDKLDAGTTRDEVLRGFAVSDEFGKIMKEYGLAIGA